MHFVTAFTITSFVSSAFAIPLTPRDDNNSSIAYFTTIAGRSSSPISKKPVNANGFSFWIGKPTKNFCPQEVGAGACPNGNKTVIEVNAKSGTCAMDVEVPGGQSVYVAQNGSLRYTVPHANAVPEDGTADGFVLTPQPRVAYDAFTYAGVGKASSWLACPDGQDVWQIYVNLPTLSDDDVPSKSVTDCLAFDGLATNYMSRDAAAWQYE